MQIKHTKSFLSLLDERKRKFSEIWEVVTQDCANCALSGKTYAISSFALTGTINYRKPFCKGLASRSYRSQKARIVQKLKKYCRNKQVTILMYWEIGSGPRLPLHAHMVIFSWASVADQIKKYWAREVGFTLLKPIDNATKWKEYCEKQVLHDELMPVIITGKTVTK